MSPSEALNHTLTTVSTGGFSTERLDRGFDSLADRARAIRHGLAGINFAFYWRAMRAASYGPSRRRSASTASC